MREVYNNENENLPGEHPHDRWWSGEGGREMRGGRGEERALMPEQGTKGHLCPKHIERRPTPCHCINLSPRPHFSPHSPPPVLPSRHAGMGVWASTGTLAWTPTVLISGRGFGGSGDEAGCDATEPPSANGLDWEGEG